MFGKGSGNYYIQTGATSARLVAAHAEKTAQATGGAVGPRSHTLVAAQKERVAHPIMATSPLTTAVLAFNHRFDYGRNILAQATLLTTGSGFWLPNNISVTDLTTHVRITDNATVGAHCLYHTTDENQLKDAVSGRGTAIFWVKDDGAGFCWVGFRQNSAAYAAFINLTTGALVSGGQGASITGVTVTSAAAELGAGWWKVRVAGLPSGINTVVAVGVSNGTNQTSYGGASQSILVRRAQAYQGDGDTPWFDPGDRETVGDLAGDHDMDLGAHGPDQYLIDRASFDGASDYGIVADFGYQGSSWSYEALVGAIEGTGERIIKSHWQQSSGNQRAWLIGINASGQLFVQLSANGSTVGKHYASSLVLDGGDLLSVTWNGPENQLKLYVNGIEDAAVTKLTDAAMSSTFNATVALLSGAREPNGPTAFFDGEIFEQWFYEGVRTPAEILALADALGVTGSGGSELTYDDWKARVAPSGTLYVVNKFHPSASDSNPGTLASPWATIQKALNTVTNPADSIWIVGGSGIDDRYYPTSELVPQASGSAATDAGRIWLVGDPSNRPLIDASVPLSVTWTSQGNNVWRAPVSIVAPGYIKSNSYHGRCAEPPLLFECIWEQIQIIHRPASGNDYALHALNIAEGATPATTAFREGDFFAEGASHTAPTHIWVRLPGNLDPNTQSMRWVDKDVMFDYSPGPTENDGRNYIGMANLDFAYGAGAQTQKDGIVTVRGIGWRLEKCSFRDGNSHGLAIRGRDHVIYNCIALRNGCCNFRVLGDQADGVWAENIKLIRCVSRYSNAKGYDESWEAGGAKISNTNEDDLVDRGIEFYECYIGENGTEATWPGRGHWSVGLWYDIFNYRGKVQRCFISQFGKAGVFQEHNTKSDFRIEDNVFWDGKLSSAGCASTNQGTAWRVQGANNGKFRRNTVYGCDCLAIHFKGSDNRGPNHDHTVEDNLFVENSNGPGAYGLYEISMEEDVTGPNFLASNTFSRNVWRPRSGAQAFRNQSAGVGTNSTTTFYTWVGGSGDTVVTSGQILEDAASQFGFMPIEPYLSQGKGAQITHPLLLSTAWNVQRFAQPV